MYARVTQFQVDPRDTDLDKAQGVFERLVVPEMRKQMGYEGSYLLRARDGKGLLVVLWESEDAATTSESSGFYAEQLGTLLTLLGRIPPEPQNYEVAFADHPVPTA
ncbi:MAG: hypothetical protein V3S98_08710 [Dehalococcoidia bacterium]